MKGEKITGLRIEINRDLNVDSCGFLEILKKNLDDILPKFKIHKIALQENWQENSKFVCLVHSKKIETLNPVFTFEFEGYTLSSSKNSKTVKFAYAFGKNTKVYIWDAESRTFVSRDNLKADIVDCEISSAPIKKQKLSILNSENKIRNLEDRVGTSNWQNFNEVMLMLEEIREQNKKREKAFIDLLERVSQQQAELLTLLREGQSHFGKDKKADFIRNDDMKEQHRTDNEKNKGFVLSSQPKKVKELSNQVEILTKELCDERKKNWLDDKHLNTYITNLVKDITGNANICSTHCFELLKSQVRLIGNKVEALPKILAESGITVDRIVFNLFPINYYENHWALLLWKVTEGEFFYFDSAGCNAEKDFLARKDGTEEACKLLREHFSKKDSKRRIKVHEVKVPLQANEEDCGALVLAMAERLIQDSGNQMKDLTSTNCKSLLSKWFDPADEAYFLRKKLSKVLKP